MQAVDTASAIDPSPPCARKRLGAVAGAPQFAVEWARSQQDVREAQRLRYRVFAQEMGARLRD